MKKYLTIVSLAAAVAAFVGCTFSGDYISGDAVTANIASPSAPEAEVQPTEPVEPAPELINILGATGTEKVSYFDMMYFTLTVDSVDFTHIVMQSPDLQLGSPMATPKRLLTVTDNEDGTWNVTGKARAMKKASDYESVSNFKIWLENYDEDDPFVLPVVRSEVKEFDVVVVNDVITNLAAPEKISHFDWIYFTLTVKNADFTHIAIQSPDLQLGYAVTTPKRLLTVTDNNNGTWTVVAKARANNELNGAKEKPMNFEIWLVSYDEDDWFAEMKQVSEKRSVSVNVVDWR